ncbi:MAG: 2-oxo acid dehydrogenase subunit E2 [Betaproteobacteria bacterium]|nr:2-oxo acid dehydrogenase subunit E2 [Betaproteobacteria bacterium]
MKIFRLPDLGEGLQEAEIIEWHVAIGDEVQVDQPLVSVETAKAIVDIPAPYSGRIAKLFGKHGEIVHLGAPLVGYEGAGDEDSGTVVGEVQVGRQVVAEEATALAHGAAGIKAMPAVRALARRLDIDLTMVTPSGLDGLITAADVQRVAKLLAEVGPLEILRGVRRAMAHNMTLARSEIVPATIMDDADIHAWGPDSDITIRLVRAMVAGCRAEPALNAWYDGHAIGRRVLKKIDVGIAMDTPDGLFVPVLRDVGKRDAADLRRGLDAMRADVKARKIPPEELRGNTITLSNFGMIAGKYSAPVVMPPTVAILGAGRISDQVLALAGVPAVHRVMPLSLTFDHRAVNGGEAGRFLAAAIADLEAAT